MSGHDWLFVGTVTFSAAFGLVILIAFLEARARRRFRRRRGGEVDLTGARPSNSPRRRRARADSGFSRGAP